MAVTPLKVKFGALLKEYLLASGKRQTEMAELLGISSAAISQVLHGKNTLCKKQLDAVVEWLQLNRLQSAQLTTILTQIRNGEGRLLSSFNRAFFSLRCERGISIPVLAEKTGLSYARLLAFEKDHTAVPIYDEAVQLSTHLGCSVVELLRYSGYQPTDAALLKDPIPNGVAESSSAWQNAPVPLLSLKTLANYDPATDLIEFGCKNSNAHKLLFQKNEWCGSPVIAIECDAQELSVNFPGMIRLFISPKRPENYNNCDLVLTEDGKFIIQTQIRKKAQTFRTPGTTPNSAAARWSIPVLELKLLPFSADAVIGEN